LLNSYGANTTATFNGYVTNYIMTVTSMVSGTITAGTYRLKTTNAPGYCSVVQQISGTPGGVGVYLLNKTFTAGSSSSTVTIYINNSDVVGMMGTDNYAAIQNAFSLSGAVAPYSGTTATGIQIVPDNFQGYIVNAKGRKVIIREWRGDGSIFGVAQPVTFYSDCDIEFEGEGEICALPNFAPNSATSTVNAVLMSPQANSGGIGGDPTTLYLGRLNNARVSSYFNFADSCIWITFASNLYFQGLTKTVGGRRGIRWGYNGVAGSISNDTVYFNDILNCGAVQSIISQDPDSIGTLWDFGVTDGKAGRIVTLNVQTPFEDDGGAASTDDIHGYSGSGYGIRFLGNGHYCKRAYQDNLGIGLNGVFDVGAYNCYAVYSGSYTTYIDTVQALGTGGTGGMGNTGTANNNFIYAGPGTLYVTKAVGGNTSSICQYLVVGNKAGVIFSPGCTGLTPYSGGTGYFTYQGGGLYPLLTPTYSSGSQTLYLGQQIMLNGSSVTLTLPANPQVG
jgi:hypothetical protein